MMLLFHPWLFASRVDDTQQGRHIAVKTPFIQWVILSIFLGGILSPTAQAQPQPSHLLYFYSPETNINHYASLKTEFDTYLSVFGNYHFQPFADRTTFERFISKEKSAVFMMSSAHYKRMLKSFPIHAVLVGISSGKATYRETLFAKKGLNNLGDLRGKKLPHRQASPELFNF